MLAIMVWHLYWVIFDPEVYPMDWSWWYGYAPASLAGERQAGDATETGDEREGRPNENEAADHRSQSRQLPRHGYRVAYLHGDRVPVHHQHHRRAWSRAVRRSDHLRRAAGIA